MVLFVADVFDLMPGSIVLRSPLADQLLVEVIDLADSFSATMLANKAVSSSSLSLGSSPGKGWSVDVK